MYRQTVQFESYLGTDSVATSEVAWSVADTSYGTVSESGFFRATPCFLGGQTEVNAHLLRDPSRRVTAEVVVVVPAFGLVDAYPIRKASDQQPVDRARVAGDVDVTVRAAALPCREIVSLTLEITGPSVDTTLGPLEFDPPAIGTNADAGWTTAVARWSTTATGDHGRIFPNGHYSLRAVRLDTRGIVTYSPSAALHVENP
ncbi:MAG: hypothetical protein R2909_12215 [Gemmatimonadales bacterium]